ncbi:hypothetical protein L3X38_017449 [Prunus dulcis]|uniref:Uncharacterized protein n=1 Tax=Prunus dulcis TaxID=3755 RepID=A0AAD4W7B4_PRUDU|nr:hypothetical protein L3X38_017449 [Prunus dulcis]
MSTDSSQYDLPRYTSHCPKLFSAKNPTPLTHPSFVAVAMRLLEGCQNCEEESLVYTSLAHEGEGAKRLCRVPCYWKLQGHRSRNLGIRASILVFWQYPCGINKGWSDWVDRELRDPSTCDILCWTGVLDAIFLSKACDIHIEAKMLRHVVPSNAKEGSEFLELLDGVENFIFRLYFVQLEEFKHVPLYANTDGLVEAPVMMAQGHHLRKDALLSVACMPPFADIRRDHLEASVHYSPH